METVPEAEQLASYRRIREALIRDIRLQLLLPAKLAALPRRK
ncbi:MAG: hypothetical protein ACLQUY_22745 [Ktedonobacterales bacterium]